MKTERAAPKCLVHDCAELAAKDAAGNYFRECAKHRPAPLTLRQQIAAGPGFDGMPGVCVVCCEGGVDMEIDIATRLCRPCFRVWRFSQATAPVRAPL